MISTDTSHVVVFTKKASHIRELMAKLCPARKCESADVDAFSRLHGEELTEALDATLRRFIASKLGVKQ